MDWIVDLVGRVMVAYGGLVCLVVKNGKVVGVVLKVGLRNGLGSLVDLIRLGWWGFLMMPIGWSVYLQGTIRYFCSREGLVAVFVFVVSAVVVCFNFFCFLFCCFCFCF